MQWAKWILPAILAINGAVMMLAPAWWYPRVPGVIETGPLNDHFVRDGGRRPAEAGQASEPVPDLGPDA